MPIVPSSKKKLNINLVLDEKFGESITDQILSWALSYGRYVIILTQIVVLSVFFTRFKLDRDYTDLKETVTQKQALIESVSDLETEIRTIQDRLSNIRVTMTNQDLQLKLLYFFQEHSPSDTTFSTISQTNEKISLRASSNGLQSFNVFLRELTQSKNFSDVILDEIKRQPNGKVEFVINAKINMKEFL